MTSLLCPDAFISPLEIDAAVTRALAEDLGRAGDITSTATVPEGTRARVIVVARKAGTISGLPLVEQTLLKLDPNVSVTARHRDGDAVAARTALMTIEGDARALLAAERTALNFLGHLSGIATAAASFVTLIAHTKARVCCTRKTTPGLRALEKYAVRCGGGFNHRFGLDDAILIKDNHIAVAGGIAAVLRRARAVAGHLVKIEIEVDTLDQLGEVLAAGGADVGSQAGWCWKRPAASRWKRPGRSRRPGSTICRPARSRIRRPTSMSRSILRCNHRCHPGRA
jgi:nicotinate-nucleotide pyrophosphorylase (carboxylating)